MTNIDSLMKMLRWNAPLKEQEEGIRLGKQIQNFAVFFQPFTAEIGKNVWENCAMIVADKADFDLRPHLPRLLEWLEDPNWPGADIIYKRLLKYEDKKDLNRAIERALACSRALEEPLWEHVLLKLRSNEFNLFEFEKSEPIRDYLTYKISHILLTKSDGSFKVLSKWRGLALNDLLKCRTENQSYDACVGRGSIYYLEHSRLTSQVEFYQVDRGMVVCLKHETEPLEFWIVKEEHASLFSDIFT